MVKGKQHIAEMFINTRYQRFFAMLQKGINNLTEKQNSEEK